MSQKLEELLAVPGKDRDSNWELDFLQQIPLNNLNVLSPDPQTGPDGWPYLMTEIEDGGSEPAAKVMHWLADKGIGLVLNPSKNYPDFVFTYGMLWFFKETGQFYKPGADVTSGTVTFAAGEKIESGEPTEAFLPKYVRAILRQFFRDQNLHDPKILLISQDSQNYDLAFSLESLGSPPEHEHQGILEALSWFFPPHYSLLMVSEKNLPKFFSLA